MSTTTDPRPFETHNPPHPGEVFRRLYLEPLGVSVTDGAKRLGVARKTLSEIVNGRAGISPQTALRIAKATGTSAESWVDMQAAYDLWQARKTTKRLNVKPLAA
jgi:addiction module HigA family antidote